MAFLMRPPQITDIQKYMVPAIDAAKTANEAQVQKIRALEQELGVILLAYTRDQ
jgi:hypothetical protein